MPTVSIEVAVAGLVVLAIVYFAVGLWQAHRARGNEGKRDAD